MKVRKGITAAEAVAKAKADPENQSFVDSLVGAAMALTGEGTDLSVKLAPGLYGYGCFLDDPTGTSHAEHGMIGTFTVS